MVIQQVIIVFVLKDHSKEIIMSDILDGVEHLVEEVKEKVSNLVVDSESVESEVVKAVEDEVVSIEHLVGDRAITFYNATKEEVDTIVADAKAVGGYVLYIADTSFGIGFDNHGIAELYASKIK